MTSPTEVYLQKARAKCHLLHRQAEELPPASRAFATEVLAELSLAFTMLESEHRSHSKSPETVASINSRREMIAELMQDAAFFRAVAENLPTGVAVVGADSRVLYVNPAGLEALGFQAEQMTERSVFDFVHPEDLPVAQNDFERLIENPDEVSANDLRVRQEDGSWIQIKLVTKGAQKTSPLNGLVIASASVPEEGVQETSAG